MIWLLVWLVYLSSSGMVPVSGQANGLTHLGDSPGLSMAVLSDMFTSVLAELWGW